MSSEYTPARATDESTSVVGAAREGYQATRGAMESEDGRSVGEILGDVSRDVSTLMRQEVALAKAEFRQSGKQAGKGIGMYAGAGVAALLFLSFLSVCVWWALGGEIGRGWSALIVAVVWAIIAAILVMLGRAEMKRMSGLQRTTETLGKVPNALKGQEEENR